MKIISPEKLHIPALRTLWKEAFGDTDEFLDKFFKAAYHPQRCKCIFSEGKAIAALYWFDCEYLGKPMAYIYAVATAEEYRGQGLCHDLMSFTHAHLESLGYAGTLLVPGEPELFKFYRSMGYEACCVRDKFVCNATDACAFEKPEAGETPPPSFSPTRINKEKYALLRRKYLPSEGVIQEKENLAFLATQLSFYAGKDFIMAGRIEKNAAGIPVFHCPEILGNLAAAPVALCKLGCEQGDFCTPYTPITGEFHPVSPFAMYHGLGDSKLAPPTYFGFAFE